jgi:hypothetical protein
VYRNGEQQENDMVDMTQADRTLRSQPKDDNLRCYNTFYNGKKGQVYASSSYAAQQEVARLLKVPPKKQYMITVMLADVTHSTQHI